MPICLLLPIPCLYPTTTIYYYIYLPTYKEIYIYNYIVILMLDFFL